MNSIEQLSSRNRIIQFGQYVQTLIPHLSQEQKQVIQRLAKELFYEFGVTIGTEVVRELINAYFPAQAGWGGYIADQIVRRVQNIYITRMVMGSVHISFILAKARQEDKTQVLPLPSFDSMEEQMILFCLQRGDHQILNFDRRDFKDFMESQSALQSFESRLSKLEFMIMWGTVPLEKLSADNAPQLTHFLKNNTQKAVYPPCRNLLENIRFLIQKRQLILKGAEFIKSGHTLPSSSSSSSGQCSLSGAEALELCQIQLKLRGNEWLQGWATSTVESNGHPFLFALQQVYAMDAETLFPFLILAPQEPMDPNEAKVLKILEQDNEIVLGNEEKGHFLYTVRHLPKEFWEKIEKIRSDLQANEVVFFNGKLIFKEDQKQFLATYQQVRDLHDCLIHAKEIIKLHRKLKASESSSNRQLTEQELQILISLIRYQLNSLSWITAQLGEGSYHHLRVALDGIHSLFKDVQPIEKNEEEQFFFFFNSKKEEVTSALKQYAALMQKAKNKLPIAKEEKLAPQDLLLLEEARQHSSSFVDLVNHLSALNIDQPLIGMAREVNKGFKWDFSSYQDGDIIFYNSYRYQRYLQQFKKAPSYCMRTLSKVGDRVIGPHVGLFFHQKMDNSLQDKPIKVAVVVEGFERKNLKPEHRLFLDPVRFNINSLFPKELDAQHRLKLTEAFHTKIKELCMEADWNFKWRELTEKFGVTNGDHSYYPIRQIKEAYHFLWGHQGGKKSEFSQLKLEKNQHLLCSEFVIMVFIEGINHLNQLIQDQQLSQGRMRYPLDDTECIEYVTPKRLYQVLKQAHVIDDQFVDYLPQIVDF